MGYFSDVRARSDDVRFQGRNGSSRPTTKMTRWTHSGHFAFGVDKVAGHSVSRRHSCCLEAAGNPRAIGAGFGKAPCEVLLPKNPLSSAYDARRAGHALSDRTAAPIVGSLGLSSLGELPVRIDDELVRDAGVEVLVAVRRLFKTDHLDIDDLGDRQSVPKNRLHELPIVFQHRRLAGMKGMGLR